MNLYFLDSDDKQHLVAKDIDADPIIIGGDNEALLAMIDTDLETRKPGFVSYYKRCWWDDYFRFWIDFGSHSEFYIVQDANKAKNVVEDNCEACKV